MAECPHIWHRRTHHHDHEPDRDGLALRTDTPHQNGQGVRFTTFHGRGMYRIKGVEASEGLLLKPRRCHPSRRIHIDQQVGVGISPLTPLYMDPLECSCLDGAHIDIRSPRIEVWKAAST